MNYFDKLLNFTHNTSIYENLLEIPYGFYFDTEIFKKQLWILTEKGLKEQRDSITENIDQYKSKYSISELLCLYEMIKIIDEKIKNGNECPFCNPFIIIPL